MTEQTNIQGGNDNSQFAPEPEATAPPGGDPREVLALKLLKQVHESIASVLELLEGKQSAAAAQQYAHLLTTKKTFVDANQEVTGGRVMEGVFDGATMVGSDGKQYSVPPNYASKSRLVDGDMMKLTIRPDGSFVYKQIAPVERRRLVGTLAHDADGGNFVAMCEGNTYKVLTASVTYFKGEPGDEIVILIPKSRQSAWAAVENIVRK